MAQEVTPKEASNIPYTNTDNQSLELSEKIKFFFTEVLPINNQSMCPIKDVLAPSMDKWSLFVIFNLGYKKNLRFNQLKKRIEGISARMLSITLKRLETSGIVSRTVYAEVPPRVEYQLTDFGEGYSLKMIELSQWFVDARKEHS